ncbi:MAG: ABC transporter permease [Oryzomonas sp.]|uniref:ABC transporter permease n=1 Tax=Oryzomonas sp. TaxID=2855186 RepID=UPI00284D3970|nr:ABC transporter permease [Oryzomonas sp.]MDR3578395.1 ABC transporter permease [Oryzomonas sp.]
MKRLVSAANFLFMLLVVLFVAIPCRRPDNAVETPLLWLVGGIQIFYLLNLVSRKEPQKAETVGDVTAIGYAVLLAWELTTARYNLVDPMLYPTPSAVLQLFVKDRADLAKGLLSSLQLLAGGYAAALIAAIPLALVIGWRKRLFRAVSPVTKVLGPIPPIVYIPYAIAILPTFKMSSIFIIFVGAFWPIFINTLNGVFTVDRKIIDSARVLNVPEGTMLFRVILPATMPAIISGANIGLVLSFILLTAAEMIGATSGLGWYVKYFSDFADYSRVIVGIIFIGLVVTVITFVMDKLEKRLLRWRS